LIQEQTRGPGLLGTDATGLPVLDPAAPEGIRSGTMWAWTNARWVAFFYSPTRARSASSNSIALPSPTSAATARSRSSALDEVVIGRATGGANDYCGVFLAPAPASSW
jgi:hypothetical protein